MTCTSLDAGSGMIKTTGQAVIGSSSAYSYSVTAVGSYPSMFLASTLGTQNAHAGMQHNGATALFFRNNVWRNSTGSDVMRNTSFSAWDVYTDVSADKFAVRRSPSGSTVASLTDVMNVDASGNTYHAGLMGIAGAVVTSRVVRIAGDVRQSSNNYGVTVEPYLGTTAVATISETMGLYVSSRLDTHVGTVTTAYNAFIDTGAVNASATVTTGVGLYVRNPAFGTTKITAYFEGNVAIGSTSNLNNKLEIEGGLRVRGASSATASGAGLEFDYSSSVSTIRSYDRGAATRKAMYHVASYYEWQIASAVMAVDSTALYAPVVIELNHFATGDSNSIFDFHAAASVDFNARIIRASGTNGYWQFANTGTGGFYLSQQGAGSMYFQTSNADRVIIDSSGNMYPASNNAYLLGKSGNEWKEVWSTDTSINSVSDRRLKTDIENTTLGLDFINRLRPVSYRMRNSTRVEQRVVEGTNETRNVTIDVTHKRYHQGLIAQEVAQAITDSGLSTNDVGIYIDASVRDGVDRKALRYGELIAPLIKAVQELNQLTAPKWAPGTPTSSGSPCTPGSVQYTEAYLFICVSVNRWSRLALEQSW